jgi:hypothetical protein
LDALNCDVFLLGFESEPRSDAWVSRWGIKFSFLMDWDKRVYRAYALETSWWRSFHPRNLWFYFRRFLRGKGIPRIGADPSQLGGDFLVRKDGTLQFAYYSAEPMDRLGVDQILDELKAMGLAE